MVIVTASAYGTDNSATLYGLRMRGLGARGIVVVDEKVSAHELDSMHHDGVRGVRLYLAGAGQQPTEARRRLEVALRQVEGRPWHIQIFTNPVIIAALKDLVKTAGVPVVFDHFGGAHGELGVAQPGFADLVELVRTGHAYVKLSAAYRLSNHPPGYADMAPLAEALLEANPERILWGTDWPHTNGELPGKRPTDTFPFIEVDDAQLLNLLAGWVPDVMARSRILVSNPARLYGFQSAG